jgi:hypothetical protein
MAQATTTRKPTGRRPPSRDVRTSAAVRAVLAADRRPPAARHTTAVDATGKLADEVLESVERGQREAIEAVRKFVDTLDKVLPALPHGQGPTKRQEIVDSALVMAERLVHMQYDFIRKVIDSTTKTLSKSDGAK